IYIRVEEKLEELAIQIISQNCPLESPFHKIVQAAKKEVSFDGQIRLSQIVHQVAKSKRERELVEQEEKRLLQQAQIYLAASTYKILPNLTTL
ncbi:16834_t:CDS:1, partial [Racocetra fulgida]